MGDTHAYLAGAALNLKPGDALLFAGEDVDVQPDHWDLRILTAVVADSVNERTRVEWDKGLGSAKWHVYAGEPAAAVRAAKARSTCSATTRRSRG